MLRAAKDGEKLSQNAMPTAPLPHHNGGSHGAVRLTMQTTHPSDNQRTRVKSTGRDSIQNSSSPSVLSEGVWRCPWHCPHFHSAEARGKAWRRSEGKGGEKERGREASCALPATGPPPSAITSSTNRASAADALLTWKVSSLGATTATVTPRQVLGERGSAMRVGVLAQRKATSAARDLPLPPPPFT